jgi:hypothetical protein
MQDCDPCSLMPFKMVEDSRCSTSAMDRHDLSTFSFTGGQDVLKDVDLILPALPVLGSSVQTDLADVPDFRDEFIE